MGCGPSSDANAIVVTVKTGDIISSSGTDNDVMIILYDENKNASDSLKLDNIFKDDFERGHTDVFWLAKKELRQLGRITKIELWQEGKRPDPWFVEHITVKNGFVGTTSVFPIHRWCRVDSRLIIKENDSYLPCDDEDRMDVRNKELEYKRKTYNLIVSRSGFPPSVETQPEDECFSEEYVSDFLNTARKLGVKGKFNEFTNRDFDSLDDVKRLYGGEKDLFPIPKCVNQEALKPGFWMSDIFFGEQRLSGCNPMQLELCTSIPEKFPVTPELVEPLLEGMTLHSALENKRLFIIDHELTNNVEPREGFIFVSPLCLFYVDNSGTLLPIAIQLFQKPAEDNPIFVPTDDKMTWLLAKMWFNNADALIHQAVRHLGYTHLVMEAICAVTNRQISISHPLFRLLGPHFLYVIPINRMARKGLINPGGFLDKCSTIGHGGVLEIIGRVYERFHLNIQASVPRDMEERGVIDAKILPNYAYRDDALPTYYAIRDYVKEIVEHAYEVNESKDGGVSRLQNDSELQAWIKELTQPIESGGCGMKGVAEDGKFTSVDQVVEAMTNIICMATIMHAAVNYNQYDYYAFPPAYPGQLHGLPPKDKSERSVSDVLKTLPDLKTTCDTMVITKLLSARDYNALGYFDVQYAFDECSLSALSRLRKRLAEINSDIINKNFKRLFPYDVLLPDSIPNSVSI